MEITVRFFDNGVTFDDWATILTAITALAAVIISIITYRSQIKHNKNSVKPIIDISVGDYVNDLFVKVKNKGVGPATIQSIHCLRTSDGLHQDEAALINYFSDYPFVWTTFANDIKDRTISPGGEMTLLEAQSDDEETLDEIRNRLKDIEIEIEYVNIYNDRMPMRKRDLSWFGRSL